MACSLGYGKREFQKITREMVEKTPGPDTYHPDIGKR